MRIAVLLFLLLMPAVTTLADDDARATQEDDIREAVFRHQIAARKSDAYFLSVLDEEREKPADPADQFLKRLADIAPHVCKKSDVGGWISAVDAKDGHEVGSIFHVGKIEWVSDILATVDGQWLDARGFSLEAHTYTVRKTKGRWKVTKDQLDLQS